MGAVRATAVGFDMASMRLDRSDPNQVPEFCAQPDDQLLLSELAHWLGGFCLELLQLGAFGRSLGLRPLSSEKFAGQMVLSRSLKFQYHWFVPPVIMEDGRPSRMIEL